MKYQIIKYQGVECYCDIVMLELRDKNGNVRRRFTEEEYMKDFMKQNYKIDLKDDFAEMNGNFENKSPIKTKNRWWNN